MSQLTTGEARERFAEVVNRAAYGKDRVILTRRGKQIAAVVPIEDLEVLQRVEDQALLQAGSLDTPDGRASQESLTREKLQRLTRTPGHRESLAGMGRAVARRWPAPDEDWDEAVARAAGEDFLGKVEE